MSFVSLELSFLARNGYHFFAEYFQFAIHFPLGTSGLIAGGLGGGDGIFQTAEVISDCGPGFGDLQRS